MKPREVQTVRDARQIVEERGLSHVKIVGLSDNDEVMGNSEKSQRVDHRLGVARCEPLSDSGHSD